MSSPDLLSVIKQHRVENPPRAFVQARGEVGELAIAESPDGARRRVVLVTAVDRIGVGHVLLAANAIDQATDLDLVITSADSGASYDLLVQAELYGPVFVDQLDGLIGSCDANTVDAMRRALDTDGASLGDMTVGSPLGGPTDPRRQFKERELEEFQEIVAVCRRWLQGEFGEVVSIHPEEFFPPPAGTPQGKGFDRLDRLVDLLDRFETTGRSLPFELLAILDEGARTELRRWHNEYGYDMWRTLQRLASCPGNPSIQEDEEVARDDLLDTFVALNADAGTRTIDLVVGSDSGDGDVVVVEGRVGTRSSFCRVRIALIGASL